MTVNTAVMSGEVTKIDLSEKSSNRGPSAVILVQHGPTRQRTDKAVQFINAAVWRVPPYVYERCKDQLKVGVLVDIVGHAQGVLKHLIAEGFVSNEFVVDRLQVVDADEGDEETAQGNNPEA